MPGTGPGGRIELIVHTPPGTPPEALARAVVEGDAEAAAGARAWDVVNRSGEHGAEAMRILIDGRDRDDLASTCTPSFLQTPLLQGLPFSFRDLTPLARLVSDRYLVVVPSSSPITSAESFKKAASARQTRTGGYMTGSINQLAAVVIQETFRTKVDYIVVKSAADILAAVLDGRLDWGVATTGEARKAIADGSLRAIAAVSRERLRNFPDVPALAEIGVDVDITLWRGLIGPPGLSSETRQRWDQLLRAALASDAWRRYETQSGVTTSYLDGDGFKGLLERENAWYAQQLTRAGLLRAAS